MVERQQEQPIVLRNDVPGDERKVRAILADWGLAEHEISRLLTADHARRPRGPIPHRAPTDRPRPSPRPV